MKTAIVAAALLVAVAVFAAASASSATRGRSLVIRLVALPTSSRPVDRPPAGPSKGDSLVGTGRLSNAVRQFGKPKGAVVGHDRATLTIVSTTALRLDGVATLPGGTITTAGKVVAAGAKAARVPVTGGTGRYAHARGTVTVTQLDSRRALNVYRLTVP